MSDAERIERLEAEITRLRELVKFLTEKITGPDELQGDG